MNDLTTAMIIQVVFSILLFALLYYFMSENSKLKKEISSILNNSQSKSSED